MWIESARPPDKCVLRWSEVWWLAAQCDRRTHSDAERTCPAVSSYRHTRYDKTAAPACRPPRRRPGRQLCLDNMQRRCTPRNCNHAVDCCLWLNLNFFTKRHTTTVIYRLTVQTLPDSIETQFTPVSGGRCELGITRAVSQLGSFYCMLTGFCLYIALYWNKLFTSDNSVLFSLSRLVSQRFVGDCCYWLSVSVRFVVDSRQPANNKAGCMGHILQHSRVGLMLHVFYQFYSFLPFLKSFCVF